MNFIAVLKTLFGLRGFFNNKKTGLGMAGILVAIVLESVVGIDLPGFDPAALGVPPFDGENFLAWILGGVFSGGVLHKIFKMAQFKSREDPPPSPAATDWVANHPGHGA